VQARHMPCVFIMRNTLRYVLHVNNVTNIPIRSPGAF
jgi:hypothetical protein